MNLFEVVFIIFEVLSFVTWVLLIGILFFMKNKIKIKKIMSLILLINLIFLGLNFVNYLKIPTENKQDNLNDLSGEFWDIETIFLAEKNIYLRSWKRNLLNELVQNLNKFRDHKDLSVINLQTIESYSPQKLKKILELRPDEFILLDVRELIESDLFGIKNSINIRYGDLANDIFPEIDKSKKIVIVCYSGIRGFLTANLLKSKGYENIAFIRGGLGSWIKQELPLRGDPDQFQFLSQKYKLFSFQEVKQSKLPKIDVSFSENFDSRLFKNLYNFYSELKTTAEIQQFLVKLKKEKIILICHTESECFDAVSLAYTFESIGGEIAGYIQLEVSK